MSLIELKYLTKEYKTGSEIVQAVNNISLEIKQGEFVALMGQSGSGKSTLLTAIGGLNKPTHGSVIVDEIDIYKLPPGMLADFRREYIGFVFQAFQLIPYLTVLENVILPLSTNGYKKSHQVQLAKTILQKVHLETKINRLINDLSGGEQQRVAIARALINDPAILLTDEPTGNLDSRTSEDIMNIFKELNDNGKTILMVTHNNQFEKYSNRVLWLSDGELMMEEEEWKME